MSPRVNSVLNESENPISAKMYEQAMQKTTECDHIKAAVPASLSSPVKLSSLPPSLVMNDSTFSQKEQDRTDYGYEDAVPDSHRRNTEHKTNCSHSDSVDYGYGDAAPDARRRSSTSSGSIVDAALNVVHNGYGYEHAVPDSHHRILSREYDDEESKLYDHSDHTVPIVRHFDPHKQPRRSSMKSTTSTEGESRRRSSISYTGERALELPDGKIVVRRTSLSFKETVTTKFVRPAGSLTHTPSDLYLQDDEFRKIKKQAKEIAAMASCGLEQFADDGIQSTTRGLEGMIGSAREVRHDRRYRAH